MKHLRKRGRAWYYDAGGKPRKWIPLGTDQATALRRYEQLLAEKNAPPGTVDAMIADYLDSPRNSKDGKPLAPGTLKQYRRYRKRLASVFRDNPATITQADIVRYLRTRKSKGVRNEVGLLSLAFTAWMEEGRLTFNPCFGVRAKLPKSQRLRHLTDAEIDAIVAKAGERLAVAIELAYCIGLRIGDLCALRWSDVNTIIETQKTGARATIEAAEALSAILDRARALQARVGSLYVLCDPRGKPWRPDTLGRHWRAACDTAGVLDAHFHDLRAAGATELDKRGGDAQQFLTHKDARTTAGYLRDRRAFIIKPLARKRS